MKNAIRQRKDRRLRATVGRMDATLDIWKGTSILVAFEILMLVSSRDFTARYRASRNPRTTDVVH